MSECKVPPLAIVKSAKLLMYFLASKVTLGPTVIEPRCPLSSLFKIVFKVTVLFPPAAFKVILPVFLMLPLRSALPFVIKVLVLSIEPVTVALLSLVASIIKVP